MNNKEIFESAGVSGLSDEAMDRIVTEVANAFKSRVLSNELIQRIDQFHGNEYKDRTKVSIAQEKAEILRFVFR